MCWGVSIRVNLGIGGCWDAGVSKTTNDQSLLPGEELVLALSSPSAAPSPSACSSISAAEYPGFALCRITFSRNAKVHFTIQ